MSGGSLSGAVDSYLPVGEHDVGLGNHTEQAVFLAARHYGEVGEVALPHALDDLVDGLVGVGPLHLARVNCGYTHVVTFTTVNLHHIRHADNSAQIALLIQHRQSEDFFGKHDFLDGIQRVFGGNRGHFGHDILHADRRKHVQRTGGYAAAGKELWIGGNAVFRHIQAAEFFVFADAKTSDCLHHLEKHQGSNNSIGDSRRGTDYLDPKVNRVTVKAVGDHGRPEAGSQPA